MKENVVSFELQYYLNILREAKKKQTNKEYKEVVKLLKEPLKKLNEITSGEVYCPQNVFESAVMLNYLGKEVHQNNFAKVNYYDLYLMNAISNYELGNIEEAQKSFKQAIKLNPVSSIARRYDIEIDLKNKHYDDVLNNLQDAMFFAYKRPDIAKIYRLAGDYLRTQKDFEMALVSYYLSLAYDIDDNMMNNINDTAKEGEIDLESEDWLSESYMRKFLNAYKIPIMPNQKIYDLALAMGEDAYNKKAYKASKYSYQIAYDLMLDDELKPKLEELAKY